MSEENVEALRRMYAAWADGDFGAWLATADPEIEWHTAFEAHFEGRQRIYRGHDGLREAWEEYRGGAWGDFTSEDQEIRDLGESVLVLEYLNVSGPTTAIHGATLGEEIGRLVTFRDGKILRTQDFLSHAEALEAAGLEE